MIDKLIERGLIAYGATGLILFPVALCLGVEWWIALFIILMSIVSSMYFIEEDSYND